MTINRISNIPNVDHVSVLYVGVGPLSLKVCVTAYQRQQANNICSNASLNESSILLREHKALKQNLLDLSYAQTEVKTIVC